MSVASIEEILDIIDEGHHEFAVAKFAQVLANCESKNFSIAQGAHEDVQAMRLNTGTPCHGSFDVFLADATAYMISNNLSPNTHEE